MIKTLLTLFMVASLVGCATTPSIPVSELRQDVRKTVFVQYGEKPINFSTGVIDTASFWGTYGDSVATQTGGWLWSDLADSGQQETQQKQLSNAELVERLYSDHQMMPIISEEVFPELAQLWRKPYSSSSKNFVAGDSLSFDPNSRVLSGLVTDANLVLMMSIQNINLTERFSMGAAFASGFTMGTNEKSLTTEVLVKMQAFKRNASGELEEVWSQPCGTNYTTMDTSYYLNELVESKEKMTEILNEATQQSVESCKEALASLASS